MALPNTGITTSMVASAIGASTNDVGTLCSHPNVNKWSRWKPVNMNSLTDRNHPFCGAILPYTNSALILSYKDTYWSYDKPNGGSTSPYRLGDFRGYDHTIKRSDDFFGIQSITDAGSNFAFNCYFGGINSTTLCCPKFMPNLQNAYFGLSLFAGNEIDTINTHIYSKCGLSKMSDANAELITIEKTYFSGYNFVLVIPFISEYSFTASTEGAGNYKKYTINGFDTNFKAYKLMYPNGQPTYPYLIRNIQFTPNSTYGFSVKATALSQIETDYTEPGRLYVGYKLYDAANGQGNVLLDKMTAPDVQVPSFTVPALGSVQIPEVSASWGSGITPVSIEIRYKQLGGLQWNSSFYNF